MNRRQQSKSTEIARAASPRKGIVAAGVRFAPGPDRAGGAPSRREIVLAAVVCVFLLLAVLLVFWQTVNFDFVNFDDSDYVYANPNLARGFSAQGIHWAFTARQCANWHPLTWLSYLVDYQFCGLKPWGYHLTNVLLHAATAISLFLVLWRMTGELWPSACVAAAFAIHPLRVESVAWVSERKDVLSGLFFVLTLGAYAGYVRRPFSWARYLAVLLLFALGLMAKPMLVTLPFVLLLLDYWPLRRMERGARFLLPARLVYEKIPLVAMAAASCAATFWAQTVAIVANEYLPWDMRFTNAIVSYARYLVQTFYPAELAAFYPFPPLGVTIWQAAGALLLLGLITAGAVAFGRRCPWLPVGWFWYLGMLVPVIGLVQVGGQSMADRYTYLPQIGLIMVVAWGAQRMLESWPRRGWLWGAIAAVALASLMEGAWIRTSTWRDSETLWKHALDCTSDNVRAHYNLGVTLGDQKRFGEAISHLQKAVEIDPDYVEAHYNLGLALVTQGQIDEAIVHFRRALEIDPRYVKAYNNLGVALASRGKLEEATALYRKAVELKPDYAAAHHNLGNALVRLGQVDEAIAHFRRALEIKPDFVEARKNLDAARGQKQDMPARPEPSRGGPPPP